MTLEPQNPGAGAGDPAVLITLYRDAGQQYRKAKASGNTAARLTAWLARMDIKELWEARAKGPEQVAA